MITPVLNSTGKFVLKLPYKAQPNVNYTVTAIREFSDIYPKNIDVYDVYYKPNGLINGASINGEVFSFDAEVQKRPAIVTLEGADDTVLYVPTTYVESQPIISEVKYSRLLLTIDLGAVPDILPVSSILSDIEELVDARFGITSAAKVLRTFTDKQPTVAEHLILEESRVGGIKTMVNNYSENVRLKQELSLAAAKIETLTSILVENQLI